MTGKWITAISMMSIYLAVSGHSYKIPRECPKVDPMNTTVHLAHEIDCTKFYVCDHGRKILMECPFMDAAGNRLHFNPKLQVCDWPWHANCKIHTTTTEPTTEIVILTSTQNNTEVTEITEIVTNGTTESNSNNNQTTLKPPVSTPTRVPTTPPVTSKPTEATSAETSKVTETPKTTPEVTETTTEISTNPTETTSVEISTESGKTETPKEIDTTSQAATKPTIVTTVTTPKVTELPETTTEIPETTAQATIKPTEATSALTPKVTESPEITTKITETTSQATSKHTESTTKVTTISSSTISHTTIKPTEPAIQTTPKNSMTTGQTTEKPTENTSQTTFKPTESTSHTTLKPVETTISSTTKPTTTSQITTESTQSPTHVFSTTKPPNPSTTEGSSKTTHQIPTTIFTIIPTNDFDANDSTTHVPLPLPQCTSDVSGILYPHETDCSLFYECNYGDKVLRQCPGGLYFDVSQQACLWPWETNCVSSTTPAISTTDASDPENIQDLCPTDNSRNGVLYPHECVCSKFYICDNGDLVLKQCPSDLHFNPEINTCDWPNNVKCKTSNDGSVNSDVSDTNKSTDKHESTTSSSMNSATTPSDSSTTKLISQSPSAESKCPDNVSNVKIPHETNCVLYYECRTGKKILKSCTSGLEFNPELSICDWPEYAGCRTPKKTVKRSLGQKSLEDVEIIDPAITESSVDNECLGSCPAVDPIDYSILIRNKDCRKFCECSSGKAFVFNCPPGLEFNTVEKVCDFPELAGCSSDEVLIYL